MLMATQLIGFGRPSSSSPIQFVGRSSGSYGGSLSTFNLSTTSLTSGIDTQMRQGDTIVVVTGWVSSSDGNPGVLDTTLTWTETGNFYVSNGVGLNVAMAVAYADVTPPTGIVMRAIGVGSSTNAAALMVFRGTAAQPLDVAAVTATGTTGSPNPAAIVPASDGALVVTAAALADTSTNSFTAAPTGYSGFTTIRGTNGLDDFACALAYQTGLTGGLSEDPAAFTLSATLNAWAAVTMALRPA